MGKAGGFSTFLKRFARKSRRRFMGLVPKGICPFQDIFVSNEAAYLN